MFLVQIPVRRIARRAAFSKGFQAATLPLEYDRSVAVSPRILRREFTFFTRFHVSGTPTTCVNSRNSAWRSCWPPARSAGGQPRLRSTGRQSCQPEFRGYRHSRRAARAVALHAAQLPGGPARQGQAHAGLGPSGGQQPGPVHADRRAAPAGLRHCRCGRRDPRGARSRRQAAGQRGGGRSASGGQGRAGVGVQLRARRGEAAARC